MSPRVLLLLVAVLVCCSLVSAATRASAVQSLKARVAGSAAAETKAVPPTEEEVQQCFQQCGNMWRACTMGNPAEGSAEYKACEQDSLDCNTTCKQWKMENEAAAAAALAKKQKAKVKAQKAAAIKPIPPTPEEVQQCFQMCGNLWRGCTWNNPAEGTAEYRSCEAESLDCNNTCKKMDSESKTAAAAASAKAAKRRAAKKARKL